MHIFMDIIFHLKSIPCIVKLLYFVEISPTIVIFRYIFSFSQFNQNLLWCYIVTSIDKFFKWGNIHFIRMHTYLHIHKDYASRYLFWTQQKMVCWCLQNFLIANNRKVEHTSKYLKILLLLSKHLQKYLKLCCFNENNKRSQK